MRSTTITKAVNKSDRINNSSNKQIIEILNSNQRIPICLAFNSLQLRNMTSDRNRNVLFGYCDVLQ